MQLLTPPENVDLGKRGMNTEWFHRNSVHERTGYHKLQRAIQPVRSFRTTAPAENGERPDPTNLGSCHGNNGMSA